MLWHATACSQVAIFEQLAAPRKQRELPNRRHALSELRTPDNERVAAREYLLHLLDHAVAEGGCALSRS